jgi:hypothetical protein
MSWTFAAASTPQHHRKGHRKKHNGHLAEVVLWDRQRETRFVCLPKRS